MMEFFRLFGRIQEAQFHFLKILSKELALTNFVDELLFGDICIEDSAKDLILELSDYFLYLENLVKKLLGFDV